MAKRELKGLTGITVEARGLKKFDVVEETEEPSASSYLIWSRREGRRDGERGEEFFRGGLRMVVCLCLVVALPSLDENRDGEMVATDRGEDDVLFVAWRGRDVPFEVTHADMRVRGQREKYENSLTNPKVTISLCWVILLQAHQRLSTRGLTVRVEVTNRLPPTIASYPKIRSAS